MENNEDLRYIHEIDQMVAALLSNGDMIKVDEKSSGPLFEPTAKGVAKGVLSKVAMITAKADEEGRNYTAQERKELLEELAVLQQALSRTKTFSQRKSPSYVPLPTRSGRRWLTLLSSPPSMIAIIAAAIMIWHILQRRQSTRTGRHGEGMGLLIH